MFPVLFEKWERNSSIPILSSICLLLKLPRLWWGEWLGWWEWSQSHDILQIGACSALFPVLVSPPNPAKTVSMSQADFHTYLGIELAVFQRCITREQKMNSVRKLLSSASSEPFEQLYIDLQFWSLTFKTGIETHDGMLYCLYFRKLRGTVPPASHILLSETYDNLKWLLKWSTFSPEIASPWVITTSTQ